ncbi:hypothetical protein A6S26_32505 [Nostoc sp. ATCC 43529]|nr:hypothetical protein A6S26_32505 [Nostoc sp. ATCC 43529]
MTKTQISYLATPQEIAEYRQVLLKTSLLRLKIGLQILDKVRAIQAFHQKNPNQLDNLTK